MATTRIIPLHQAKGKTVSQSLYERVAYAIDPEKTENYEYVSCFECCPELADAEFAFSKTIYAEKTGRNPIYQSGKQHDVLAYQVRQSFKPGEITPAEANEVGYELASRFLKGKHAFLVATHTDKQHIHNHIIWNSTTLDCTRKFRDFRKTGRAIRRLSDMICLEHGLSVIDNPKSRFSLTYNKGDRQNQLRSVTFHISLRSRGSFAFLPLAKTNAAASLRTGGKNSAPRCSDLIFRCLIKDCASILRR